VPDLYALLVGIDRYDSPAVRDLRGSVRDVESVRERLTDAVAPGTIPHTVVLTDGDATREAVIAALRGHLGRAGSRDTALFWFSGHGSEAIAPQWCWFLEPGAMVQTLVCADSRRPGVPDLWDKELSVLLDTVAERAGHVAVVLDSCHSDGATRTLIDQEPAARTRSVEPAAPRTATSFIREVRDRAASDRQPEHVVLAACRSFETAQELPIDGGIRGVFTWALLDGLRRLGPGATYRELLTAAQTGVELHSRQQVPQLRPAVSPLADQVFLGGKAGRPGTGIRMRHTPEGWEIDAGAVHGLPRTGEVRVAARGERTHEAVVSEVSMRSSRVAPAGGWTPAPHEQFPVVVTQMPLPRTTVELDDTDPSAVARIGAAVDVAGPHGGPSPHLRRIATGTAVPDLRVAVDARGRVTVADHHGHQVAELSPAGAGSPHEVVAALEHIARWRLMLRLDNPVTSLHDPVRVEVVRPEPGQQLAPKTGGALPVGDDGVYHLNYRRTPGGWEAPEIFLRLHNTSDRMLYCVLLDLTPRFKVHAQLFPGDFVAPGESGAALAGRRIRVYFPGDTRPEPGRSITDRLKLIVAEEQFSQQPFLMPALGARIAPTRGALGRRGLLERLAGAAVHRDLGETDDTAAYDWTTRTVTLRTEVPG
jgi:hypothetical protein